MTPNEPHEDVIDLMDSPLFDSRLSYIIGSALDEKDLLKARADVAKAIFFISDSQADYNSSTCEDAATVLRALSIINYNPDLECFVEVLNEHDKRTLEDCHADVVLCLDDYKFTLQARNSICMGLSTMCENLFNSFSSDGNATVKSSDHWLSEYQHGLGMEIYYFNIDSTFFSMLNFNWALLVECIYLEFGIMMMGVSRTSDHSVFMNPRNYEHNFPTTRDFYMEYSVGVVIAPNYNDVLIMQYALTDLKCVDLILKKLSDAEFHFTTRNAAVVNSTGKNLNHERKTLLNLQHLSTRSLYADADVDEVEQARVLSTLLRNQKLFDNKFSLKKICKKAYARKTGSSKNFHKSMSLHSSTNGFDSDSSSGNERENFLGYIEEDDDDTDYSFSGGEGNLSDFGGDNNSNSPMSDLPPVSKSPISNNNSASYSYTTRSFTGVDKNHWSAEGGTVVLQSVQDALTMPPPSSAFSSSAPSASSLTKTTARPMSPSDINRKSRNAFISLSSQMNIENVGEEDKETGKEIGKDKVSAGLAAEDTVKEENDGEGKIKKQTKRKKRISNIGEAARKVSQILKADDVWGDAVSIVQTVKAVNLHCEPEGEDIEHPAFLNFHTITPLQRQIMQAKKSKKFTSRSARKTLQRVSSKVDPHPHPFVKLGSVTDIHIDCDGNGDKKPVLKKSESKNFATTLKSFQVNKSKTFKRQSSSQVLNRIRSFGNNEDEASERVSASFHRAKSGVSSSSDSIQLAPMRMLPALDIGEIMGASASPSVKRTLSKSKSKDITVTASSLKAQHAFLRADSFEEKKVSDIAGGQKNVEEEETEAATRVHGSEKHPCAEIKNASSLKDHVIVLGCLDFLIKFVKALRKSNLSTHENYHSILIVSEREPDDWGYIKKNYKDVYFLKRSTKTDQDLLYMNLRNASSITMFGSRTRESLDEATNIDSMALFLYLALERKIPANVNITVEIFRPSSVGVINSAVNHNHVVMGSGVGEHSTGISRKGSSIAGTGMKIGGNDHKSFYIFPTNLETSEGDDDDDDDESGRFFDKDFAFSPPTSYKQDKIVPLNNSARITAKMVLPNSPSAKIAPTSRSTKIKNKTIRLSVAGMSNNDNNDLLKSVKTEPEIINRSPNRAMNFWGSHDTHHVMPVFAAGRAFVPTAFDSIFIQVRLS